MIFNFNFWSKFFTSIFDPNFLSSSKERYSISSFFNQLNNNEQNELKTKINKINLDTIELNSNNYEFEFKLNQLDNEFNLFIKKYQIYIIKQSVICIQQTFRKYQLLIEKVSSSKIDCSLNNSNDCEVVCKQEDFIDCNMNDDLYMTDLTIKNQLNIENKIAPLEINSNNLNSKKLSRQQDNDLEEGSFKNHELLNYSMDIDSTELQKDDDEHPFQSDEIKNKRKSSLSCMDTLSAKR